MRKKRIQNIFNEKKKKHISTWILSSASSEKALAMVF